MGTTNPSPRRVRLAVHAAGRTYAAYGGIYIVVALAETLVVYAHRYGSPTILVNGRDVAGHGEHDGAGACRIYRDSACRVTRE